MAVISFSFFRRIDVEKPILASPPIPPLTTKAADADADANQSKEREEEALI